MSNLISRRIFLDIIIFQFWSIFLFWKTWQNWKLQDDSCFNYETLKDVRKWGVDSISPQIQREILLNTTFTSPKPDSIHFIVS